MDNDQPRVRFRQSFATLTAVVLAAAGSVAIAGQGWWFTPVLVLPLAALWWVLRSGVDVDPNTVTVRNGLRTRRLPWRDIAGFSVARGRVRAQLVDRAGGAAVRLPAVTPNTLDSVLAAGGRVIPPAPEARDAGEDR